MKSLKHIQLNFRGPCSSLEKLPNSLQNKLYQHRMDYTHDYALGETTFRIITFLDKSMKKNTNKCKEKKIHIFISYGYTFQQMP